MKTIEIVLKVAERCNINCDYCYMFNLGNEDYKNNPKYMAKDTLKGVVKFLKEGVKSLQVDKLDIILHGGEPLMMGKQRFIDMCDMLTEGLGSIVTLRVRLQTNAILVNNDWIKIFSKYDIYVGVSIDGPEKYNDLHRIDHKGNGTHKKIVRGIELLQTAAKKNIISAPGALIVINPELPGKEVYQHIVEELNFSNVNFLLPMVSHETADGNINETLSKYLIDITHEHITHGHKYSKVRLINQFASYIKQDDNSPPSDNDSFHYIIGISSAGQLDVDDEFKTIENKYSEYSIFNSSLTNFVQSTYFQEFERIRTDLPNDCIGCCWKNYCVAGCGVGSSLGRYSLSNKFNNKSVFCDALRQFYSYVSMLMLESGLSKKALETILAKDKNFTVLPPITPAISNKIEVVEVL